MKLVLQYLKKHKRVLVLALVLTTINSIFSLLDPEILRLLIDNYANKADVLPREIFIKGIILLLLAVAGVALISRIAKNFQDYFVSYITQKVGTEMYSKSVQHTFSLSYDVFEDQKSGELLQKLQKARTDTQAIISSAINTIFLSLIGILFVMIYSFTVHWSIGTAYFLMIPILGFFSYTVSKRIKDAQKSIVRESAILAGSTTETLRNVELVKSLGLETQEITRLNTVNNLILELELKKIKLIRKLSFLQGTMINTLRVVLMFLMLYLIFIGIITLGEFFSLLFYSFFIFAPLGELGHVSAQYQEARASNEQLAQILKLKPRKKPVNAKKITHLDQVEFNDVSFSYNEENASLRNISLKIKNGETIAFVGPSGSGKTTMVKLLVGLYEASKGKLLLNKIDSRKIDYDDFRRKIGLVSQETQLFAGSIRENLLFVNPNATDKECFEVLKLASVMNIVERGGKGLDTRIGEGGIKISGGERQRLAIARALLRNPELIIFDEATSSLDSITEKAITKTIQNIIKLKPNLIIVLVAHRLSTVAHANTIYVFEKGKIVERGNHNNLLKKKGLYAAFWREQISNGE